MALQELVEALGPQAADEVGGALDVREDEGDGAGRALPCDGHGRILAMPARVAKWEACRLHIRHHGADVRDRAHDGRSAQLHDTLNGLALFADLEAPELERVAHTMEERFFAPGERILRQGLSGSGFYLILEGEATIRVNDRDYGTLARGDFFGELSVLLGESPVADIVATGQLRCAVIAGPELRGFLMVHPSVMFRMLVAEARKLSGATRGRT